MISTQALLLETAKTTFGGTLLLLFTPSHGKIHCSVDRALQQRISSPPALIDIELVREKRGLYKTHSVTVDDTFLPIRSDEKARKAFLHITKLIKQVIPIETPLPEIWKLLNSLFPCLHLFEDDNSAYFLIAYSLAILQGMDLSWLHDMSSLDKEAKEALLSFSHMDAQALFSLKCPPQALQYLLEELGVEK